jgi:hypothetical protein
MSSNLTRRNAVISWLVPGSVMAPPGRWRAFTTDTPGGKLRSSKTWSTSSSVSSSISRMNGSLKGRGERGQVKCTCALLLSSTPTDHPCRVCWGAVHRAFRRRRAYCRCHPQQLAPPANFHPSPGYRQRQYFQPIRRCSVLAACRHDRLGRLPHSLRLYRLRRCTCYVGWVGSGPAAERPNPEARRLQRC